jgi:hypothetical protein
MNENGLSFKAVQKAEGEIALEFIAHETTMNLDGNLWEVTEADYFNMRKD